MGAVGARGALLIALAVAALALVALGVAEVLDVDLLVDPVDAMDSGGLAAAALGVGLLVADIVLPVPSSLVMVAHGALFGVVPGMAISLVGRLGNAVVGVLIGRSAGRRWGSRGAATPGRGTELVERWGLAAVVLTRPIPVVAESTVVAAGALGLAPAAVVGAAALGALPEALLYALAGAVAASFGSTALVFVAVVVLAAGLAVTGRKVTSNAGAT